MDFVLMGIGNELKGDDGIGNLIAREFSSPGWLSLPCETVPDNFTAVIKREKPDVLVMVDAADMGMDPGEVRIIPMSMLDNDVLGTHGIPLRHLVSYLSKHAGKIIFIGIQPGSTTLGENISPELMKAGRDVMDVLKRKDWESLREFG
jgi:hydrogenase 3 maturation protease